MATRHTLDERGNLEVEAAPPRLPPGGNGVGGPDLRTLFAQLTQDASQLAHDELTLARLEIRDVANAFSSDIQAAGRMLVKDMVKVGVALSLASLAGLALTAGAILGIGRLLGGAFWAGGLIVGVVLAVVAAVLARSAATDLQESESLRFEGGREALDRDQSVLKEEARETGRFAREEARAMKRKMKSDATMSR